MNHQQSIEFRQGRSRSRRGILLAGVLLAAALLPQDAVAADTLRISAGDAASMALAAGPEALRSRLEVERARAGRAGIGGFLPGFPEVEVGGSTDAPFAGHGEGEFEVGVSQEIEIGGQYFLRRAAADAAVAQAELQMEAAGIGLRTEARVLHARLLAAQERMEIVERLVAFSRRLDTIAVRQYEVGEISELDRNAVGIGAARGEMALLEAESMIAEASAELRLFLGLPAGTTLIAVGSPLTGPSIAAILDTAAAVERGLAAGDDAFIRARPDWQALERGAERYRAERDLARRWWVPDLKLGLGLLDEKLVLDASHDDPGHLHPPENYTDRLLTFHAGVQIPLPFSGLYDQGEGELRLAEAEIAAADAERGLLAARINADLASALARLRGAAARLAVYNERIAPLVNRNMDLLERGYAAGELTATEVVAQQEGLLGSAEALVEARREFAEALAGFDQALGR